MTHRYMRHYWRDWPQSTQGSSQSSYSSSSSSAVKANNLLYSSLFSLLLFCIVPLWQLL